MQVERPVKRAHIAAHLAQKYPHLFSFPVPLKVGIGRDLLRAPDRQYSDRTLSSFLHKWCSSDAYCDAVEKASARYDLEGRMHPVVTNHSRRSANDR